MAEEQFASVQVDPHVGSYTKDLHFFQATAALLGISLWLLMCQIAGATVVADANDSFQDLSISSTAGTLVFQNQWQSAAYAQATANAQYISGASSSSAGALGDFSIAAGSALTGTLAGSSGSSSANLAIPGTTVGFDTAAGRSSVNNTYFEITGGSGAVNVTFSAQEIGRLNVSTDISGVTAEAETIFDLEVNGASVLFDDRILSIGPSSTQSQSFTNNLTYTIQLDYNTRYWLWAEADSEAMGVNSSVPEPAGGSAVVACLGLALLGVGLVRRRPASWKRLGRGLLILPGAAALLGFGTPSRAMYLGSDAPDVCEKCGFRPTRQLAGTVQTSLTEGNLREEYPVVSLRSSTGPTLQLGLVYNSYNADGSKAELDTGLGFGWTHSYNIFLFQQRGHVFRMDANGRVTQYYMSYTGAGGSYTSDTGYFETLTNLPDGSFIITNKNQSWWHFASVPNTPFLVEGPVFRLIQMGDRNQNVTTLTYSGGLLMSVTDTYGRSLTFGYNAQNKLTSITDPLGRTTQFQYDGLNRMPITITDPSGNSVRYTYNAMYQITRKVDRDGRNYLYLYEHQRPFAVADGLGQAWFSMSNPANWAVNSNNLALNLQRQYVPGTTATTDGRGNLWHYSYDTNGYLTQLTAPDGSTTTYTYDPGTLMPATITDANGHTTTYQYDAMGNRTSTTDAMGFVTTYTYEPVFNMMTSTTDPNGRTTTYQYDAHGNRTNEVDPLGNTTRYTYDGHGNTLSTTDKNGHTTTYTYDGFGNRISQTDPLGDVSINAYDANGNRLSSTDPRGFTTRYQYDALDRLVGTTNALNGVTTYTYDPVGHPVHVTDPNTNSTSYDYDIRARLIQTTDAMGGVTSYGYDPNDNRIALTNQLGHPTAYAYDTLNRMIRITDAMDGVTSYTYDAAGNRLSSTDPNGNVTTYGYDALNRRINMTDALAGMTAYDYATIGGPPCCSPTIGSDLITEKQDAVGNITFYVYDELNRRTQIIRKNNGGNTSTINPGDAVTTTTYDAVGNVLSVTDPATNTTAYTYDSVNRLVKMVNAAGDTNITAYDADGNVSTAIAPNGNSTTNSYDALDRVTTIYDGGGPLRTMTYDADGNVLSRTDGLGHATTYMYDGLSRQIEMVDPLLKTTRTVYDADNNVISTTDRNGHTTTYTYDALDRRVSVIDALGNTTQTAYDADSNLIQTTDADGRTTTYGYDALNRRIFETDPDTSPNTISYTYDGVGNRISRTDQEGQVTTYTYNDLYFMTNRTYTPSGARETFTYDLDGRLLAATNRTGWTDTFGYDGANRLTMTTQNGRVLTYTYDIPGRVQTNTYPSGRTLNYAYDARNRLVTLNDNPPSPAIATYTYDAADRVTGRAYRNGTTSTYGYNFDNWITSLQHSNASALIAGFSYIYDNEGNKLYESKLDVPTNSEAYIYDALDRLTRYDVGTLSGGSIPSPRIRETYNLDPVGNWSSMVSNSVTQTRTYGGDNELLTINSQTITYDADGNPSNDGVYSYSYDEENRLIQVERLSDFAVVGQYFYDALGRRIEKIANPAGTPSTMFYYYDDGRIVEEQDSGGTALATYTYGNYVDELLTMDRGGQSYYYHQNALWSVEAITSSTASPVERYAYDAYGYVSIFDGSYVALSPNSWNTPHSSIGSPWLFTGRQLDEETGLYYYRARYYDARKGRFLQRDPIEYIDRLRRNPLQGNRGVNLYEAFFGDPLTFLDPSGMDNPGCDIPNWAKPPALTTGANRDCYLRCCAIHDLCYFRNGCSYLSWGLNAAGGLCSLLSSCARCNSAAVGCFERCATGISPPSTTIPRWFCPNGPNRGRFYNNWAAIPASCWDNGVKPAGPY